MGLDQVPHVDIRRIEVDKAGTTKGKTIRYFDVGSQLNGHAPDILFTKGWFGKRALVWNDHILNLMVGITNTRSYIDATFGERFGIPPHGLHFFELVIGTFFKQRRSSVFSPDNKKPVWKLNPDPHAEHRVILRGEITVTTSPATSNP